MTGGGGMSSYNLSWHEQIKIPYIQKRKWWQIFCSDTLAYRNSWVLNTHVITEPKLVDLLMHHSGATIRELDKLMFTDKTICNLCLTKEPTTTTYISTQHGEG